MNPKHTPTRSVRIPDDLWQAVKAKARADGEDASKVIVRELRDYVAARRGA